MFLNKSKLATAVMCGLLSVSVLMAGCGGGAKKDAGNTIKIGVVSELTGPNASYGNSVVKGMKLAVKEINDKGGVDGKKIELAIADDKSEPAEAANAMSKVLNQDKAKLSMGIFTSSNAIAACNVSESAKVPFLAIGATNPKVTLDKDGKAKPNTFRVCFIDPFQGTVGANFVLDTLKLKKAVVLIDNSSDYSKGLAAFFKEAFTKKGGQILGEEAYLQKDTDFKAILTKIKTLNPEVLYVPGYYEEVGKIIKQARELDIKAAFVGGDGWDSPKLVEIAGGPALENTYFTNHYSPDATNAESKAFVAAYQKEYNEKPDAPAVLGYDGAKLMADAIKRAGSTDGAKVSAALAATKDFPAVTGKTSLNATHDAVKSAVIIAFKDGKQTYKTTVNP
ncbi:MAG: ABC transporter substrate-binding protein [Acidaminococcaceae bacterium]|jgi:branched-chain amino acid transport system substrate-binding protein|nr:ABC transporter substrate-binding protein [Acidaminococcaceae bacterium]